MVETPSGQSAGVQTFQRLPLKVRRSNEPLKSRDLQPYGIGCAASTTMKRQEADRFSGVFQNGDFHPLADGSHELCELRPEERTCKGRVIALNVRPRRPVRIVQSVCCNCTNCHVSACSPPSGCSLRNRNLGNRDPISVSILSWRKGYCQSADVGFAICPSKNVTCKTANDSQNAPKIRIILDIHESQPAYSKQSCSRHTIRYPIIWAILCFQSEAG